MRHRRLLLASAISAAVALAAAACSKSDTAPSAASSSSCTVTLGTATTSVSAAATTGTLPVTAASTCSWSAASSASFLTISSGATGTGNGTVAYSIAANTGAARSASITVNGASVNFTQAAASVVAPTGCAVVLSRTSLQINSGGGTATVDVTGASNCSWTSASNSSFLTATASATGNGTVTITAVANPGSTARTGTVTIGGQTVTVSQDPGIFASFNLFDPGQSTSTVNVCQFRSANTAGAYVTCTLRSTSFTTGAIPIRTYAYTLQYTYGTVKVSNTSGSDPTLDIVDTCGLVGSTDDGALNPLDVTLTVTDANGNTATAKSGSGNQPALFVQMFTCGK